MKVISPELDQVLQTIRPHWTLPLPSHPSSAPLVCRCGAATVAEHRARADCTPYHSFEVTHDRV